MKTYGELKDFVRRTGVIHECVPMISSFTRETGTGCPSVRMVLQEDSVSGC